MRGASDNTSTEDAPPLEELRRISTSIAADRLSRSVEYVRQAYHRGVITGIEQDWGTRSRILLDPDSVEAHRLDLVSATVADIGLSTADLEIAVLRDEVANARLEIERLRHENQINALKSRVSELEQQNAALIGQTKMLKKQLVYALGLEENDRSPDRK